MATIRPPLCWVVRCGDRVRLRTMSSVTTSITSWPAGGLRRRAGLRARKGGSNSRHATPSTAKHGGHARTLGRVRLAVKTPHHVKISVTEQEVVRSEEHTS